MDAQVIVGDCLVEMPKLDATSVDAIVTDPPYGLGFMGKAWDHGLPGEPFWREALRVAKPGAHLVAFGGTRTYHRLICAIEDAGWEIRDCLSWLYGSGFPKSHNGEWGGTALKPGWEPIILARKPLAGTVAANFAKHGTGALNIGGCRIEAAARPLRVCHGEDRPSGIYGGGAAGSHAEGVTDQGRWPANVVLDEGAAALLDEQSGERKAGGSLTGAEPSRPALNTYGEYTDRREWQSIGDSGGASRFFYTAKASRSERNAGLDGFTERKPHADEPNGRAWDIPGSHSTARANHHPTVKPLDLMQWLCRLVTPPGGLILDPFTGSGTTGRAAVAEGFRFIGIEREPEYAEIARARICEYAPLFAGGSA